MGFEADNGTVLTDEMLDKRAEEYEDGTWSGHGEVTMGRPRLYDEDMGTVSSPPPLLPHPCRGGRREAAGREHVGLLPQGHRPGAAGTEVGPSRDRLGASAQSRVGL